MTISVMGIGWLTREGYGCVRSALKHEYGIGEGAHTLAKKGIFSHPFKNFGRLDGISRMTAYAVSLALQDAAMEYAPHRKQDIGIVGTNAEGSLRADIAYFKDYVDSGRTLSRGNLFIYTLPSSPFGEASIHFGFLGPLLYAAGKNNSLATVLDIASDMILAQEAPVILAGAAEMQEAVFFVIKEGAGPGASSVCSLTEARSLVERDSGVAELVEKFLQKAARKG